MNGLKNFTSKIDSHTLEVITKSFYSMIIKIIGMVAGLGVSIFLGREIGPEGVGIINYSLQITAIFLVLSVFGFDNVLIKFIAIAKSRVETESISNFIKSAVFVNLSIASLILVFSLISLPFICNTILKQPEYIKPLQIMLLMLIPLTLTKILTSGLSGLGKIWQRDLFNESLGFVIVGILLIGLNFYDFTIDVMTVCVVYVVSRFLVFIFVRIYWAKLFKKKFNFKNQFSLMFPVAKPLVLVSFSSVISIYASSLIVGSMLGAYEVGIYSVSARLALLATFFLQVTSASISPKLAVLYNDRNIQEMGLMVRRVTAVLFLLGLFFLLLFIFFGDDILNIWGAKFVDGYRILCILSFGQFLNMSTGFVGVLLTMCNQEVLHGKISVFSSGLNIVANIIGIKFFGITGAAVATAGTIILTNFIKFHFVQKKLNIRLF